MGFASINEHQWRKKQETSGGSVVQHRLTSFRERSIRNTEFLGKNANVLKWRQVGADGFHKNPISSRI
ncbi:MAG: hypothetical protein H0T94_10345 [Acidimicrobiia bacterium]|nr:hypothetical protein [Acidimicrobiia bacterium]